MAAITIEGALANLVTVLEKAIGAKKHPITDDQAVDLAVKTVASAIRDEIRDQVRHAKGSA